MISVLKTLRKPELSDQFILSKQEKDSKCPLSCLILKEKHMQFIRTVKDGGHYDLIVCGAGPGGTAAAISAAREGKHVLLMDAAGCLGGYWTSGLMGIALDMPGKGGIPLEIVQKLLVKKRAEWVNHASYAYDIESMKLVLETLVQEAGVDVLLYSRVTDVILKERRISSILADGMTSMGFSADFFVDGTGHGKLGELAGCNYSIGFNGYQQPASLEAVVAGVPIELWQSDIHNPTVKQRFKKMLMDLGVNCTYPQPLLFRLTPNAVLHKMAINHQYDVSANDDFGMSRATLEARQEIGRAADALASQPGWDNFTLAQTAEQLGLRDSRRIEGLYTVTVKDALYGQRFDDAVSPVHFCLDVHDLSPDYKLPPEVKGYHFKPFDIPMRSLISSQVDNLLMVGRCISGDFLAHSAYRTTCTACALGEAAGLAVSKLRVGQCAKETDGKAIHNEMNQRGYHFKE